MSRRDSSLTNPNFDGWYAQASWVLTGESKPWKPERGAYGSPSPADEFSFDKFGWGAWELAARYSVLNLNFDAGLPGIAAPLDGIRGGDQKIWTAGLNWYPNNAIRFMLDYQHTDVSRLSSSGRTPDGAARRRVAADPGRVLNRRMTMQVLKTISDGCRIGADGRRGFRRPT